ncbi:phenylalanine--tRNA ligase subunit beta [Candidatus Woesearchaeota archaeon]|nr:phenylalanine--tRNA ligase subunit beta [Candidatus Woesearchaeota archaeon]
MASVTLDLKLLQRLTKLSRLEIVETLTKLGFEIEGFEFENENEQEFKIQDLKQEEKLQSLKSLIIDVTPNRPDLLSTITIAQALKTFKTSKVSELKFENPAITVIIEESVKKVRPFTACCVVKGLNIDESILLDLIQLQEKLHLTLCRNRAKAAIGIYPLQSIKPPIRFKALKPETIKFKPLDFDKELNGLEILEKHAKGKAFKHLLQGEKLFPLFIDDQGKVLSMPPIINSADTGKVTLQTKEVFVEVSGFDLDFLNKVLLIIANAFSIIGGKIYKAKLIIKHENKTVTTPFKQGKRFKTDEALVKNINNLTGLSLNKRELKALLKRMGFIVEKSFVKVPEQRTDVLHWVDLAEDALIAFGYDNLDLQPVKTPGFGLQQRTSFLESKLVEFLISNGFVEVKTFHLTSPELFENCKALKPLTVENPASVEHSGLRNSLQPQLIQVLSKNTTSKYPQKIFDIGVVFKPVVNQGTIQEVQELKTLCLAITHSKASFTEVKQLLQALAEFFNLKIGFKPLNIEREILQQGCLSTKRSAQVFLNDKPLGFAGEVHPEILERFNFEKPIVIAELNLELLFKAIR